MTAPDQNPDRSMVIVTDDSPDGVDVSNEEAVSKENAESTARLHQIRDRFQIHQTFWSPIFSEGTKDDEFVAGEQWPDNVRKAREEQERPIMTYNMLPAFGRQIVNRMRETRAQIKVTPVESNKGPNPMIPNVGGTKDYSMADIYSGIIKNIETISRADQAYDTASKHAVDHGFGWFYLMNEWSRVDPFAQDLKIFRVKNSYTVMMDPDSQEADYRDAQDAFMFGNIKRKTFQKKWPDIAPIEFEGSSEGANYEGWWDADNIRIAQYFWIHYRPDVVLKLSNGKIVYESEVGDVLDELERDQGIHVMSDPSGREMHKDVTRPVCMWQKMTARNVLEGPTELPFSAIPIFPVLGEEILVDGRTRYESAFRHARDPQKSYNYWRTSATETVALAPRAPWVATERQTAGYEDMYETANSENHAVLYYNHIDGQNPPPPPQRQFPSSIAAAELQNAATDAADMQTIIGLHEASLGAESNEKSGKAIRARQNQGATSTFQFPDNLRRAQEQCGRLMVEAIPKLMDAQKIVRIRLPDGSDDFVEINQAVIDEQSGKTVLVHDIGYGKYDVVMDTGPSYATQREEAAELQIELLKVLGPQASQNIAHLIVKNIGTPGSDEVAAILRKMLPDSLKTEDEKNADLPKGVTPDPDNEGQYLKDGEPWTPPLTPEMQVMQKQQEIDELAHKADLSKSEASIAKSEAEKETANAKRAQAEADLAEAQRDMEQLRAGAGAVEGADSGEMMTEIEQIIRSTMEEHQADPNAHKQATAEQIAEAIVEALKRTKAYVDRHITDTSTDEAASGSNNEGKGDAVRQASPVQDIRTAKRLKLQNVEKEGGVITEATAAVAEKKLKLTNIERSDEGDIVGAEVIVSNKTG